MSTENEQHTQTFAPQSLTSEQPGVAVGQQLLLVAAVFVLLFGTAITPRLISGVLGTADNGEPDQTYTTETPSEIIVPPFEDITLTANSAFVWDVQNQRALYKQNETEVLPLASVTKLMTALLAHEIIAAESGVTVDAKAIDQEGDSSLLEGETFNRQSLSDLVLISSSNDGAFALAQAAGNVLKPGAGAAAFIAAMNVRANELGLQNMSFTNPTGLDMTQDEAGAYGSAKDVAFLMEYIVATAPEILSETTETENRIYSDDGFYHDMQNTNQYVGEIPGLIGSKTGYTDLAGGNLVVAYDAGLNRPIIVSVLNSSRDDRFRDVRKLVHEANYYVSLEN